MQRLLLIALFLLMFAACTEANPKLESMPLTQIVVTEISQITITPTPEPTAAFSNTPIPTATAMPSPTNMPTATATPTNTPTFVPITNTQTPEAAFPADVFCNDVTEIPQVECEALVTIYNYTDGENWTYQDPRETSQYITWLETKTPCSWKGIQCTDNHVTEIYMDGVGLIGDLPSEIGNLSNLTFLNLEFNHLSSLPPEIGYLSNLRHLDLWSNSLTSLPPEIGNLSSLRLLELADNNLTTLPPEIGNLTNLTVLRLMDNNLRSLPPEIGNLTSLMYLDLWNNNLSSVPLEIGNLSNLTKLDLVSNNIESLPPELCASFRDDIELSPYFLCLP